MEHQHQPLQQLTFAQIILMSRNISIGSERWDVRESERESADDAAAAAAGWLTDWLATFINVLRDSHQCVA